MTEEEPQRRRNQGAGEPMEEENFPTRSPTRDAVEREMREPANVRGPANPLPKRPPPAQEASDAPEGSE